MICSIEFPGYMGDLATALTATTPQAGAPALFVKYFRQWYTLCTVNNPMVGTYFLQVETSTKINGAAAPSAAAPTGSHCVPASPADRRDVRIHGEGRIGIYANSPAANTTFYLARVLPGAKGRTLVLNFFDVGDAAQAGAITVLPPTDANIGGAFAGCTYTPPPGNSTGPPWGTFSATGQPDQGCARRRQQHNWTSNVENPDGDNFFCRPKGGDIKSVFLAAVSDTRLAGPVAATRSDHQIDHRGVEPGVVGDRAGIDPRFPTGTAIVARAAMAVLRRTSQSRCRRMTSTPYQSNPPNAATTNV